jgi:hypothetical protein
VPVSTPGLPVAPQSAVATNEDAELNEAIAQSLALQTQGTSEAGGGRTSGDSGGSSGDAMSRQEQDQLAMALAVSASEQPRGGEI